MKVIISKQQFQTRKDQIGRLLVACDASLEEINAVMAMTVKEISTDLIKIRVDDDDIVIVIDDI